MKQKIIFPGLKIPGSDAALLLCLWGMGIKRFNLVGLLDFPNVIGLDESNPETFTKKFHSYRLFPNVSKWEKYFCPNGIT